jgi:hypothetical protein
MDLGPKSIIDSLFPKPVPSQELGTDQYKLNIDTFMIKVRKSCAYGQT